ncbi:ATP-dependent Clp protease proteolytic subunit [Pseudonocardia sp. DSM 110487]|uniref:ATP-dependent Clp protease proteolytic subunit n=1 Tax=Pseudonocardia sp. DSM 110487 TaxID=2865833 RepID=UPI00272D027C|nr:ATP-dependent Clp protease proteolytic subunit [Pseudonocardia sp. DSM 110487]
MDSSRPRKRSIPQATRSCSCRSHRRRSGQGPGDWGADIVGGVSVEQITDFGRDRWFNAPEAVAYGLADEVIGDPAEGPESGTPA